MMATKRRRLSCCVLIRRSFFLLFVAAITLTLSGCWESTDLDDIAYVHQLAVTYEHGFYHIYMGILDISQVAETSEKQAPGGKQSPIWVAKAQGKTVLEAINKVYPTSPERIAWSQFNILILHDSVLHGHLKDVLETLTRYRELRYTAWIYGTHSPVKWIFTSKFPIEKNPLYYYITNPIGVEQFGYIFPGMRLNEFIRQLNEPGCTPLLPEIRHLKKQQVKWYNGKKTMDEGSVSSVGVFSAGRFVDWYQSADAAGLLWARTGGIRIPLLLTKPSRTFVYLHTNKVKIKSYKKNNKFYYKMQVTGDADVSALSQGINEDELIKTLDQKLASDIRKSYLIGVTLHSDVFNLGQIAYHQLFFIWPTRSLSKTIHSLQLQPDSLQEIVVKMRITHSGMRDMSQSDFAQK